MTHTRPHHFALFAFVTTVVVSLPVYASSTPLPNSVTATVSRLLMDLDDRGRSAVSADLDKVLKGRSIDALPAVVRFDVARLMLSLRGVGAASPWARSGLLTFFSTTKMVELPAIAATASQWQAIANACVAIGKRQLAAQAIAHCRAQYRRPRDCRPTMVARTLAQMAWYDDAMKMMQEALQADDGQDIDLTVDAAQIADMAGRYSQQLKIVRKAFAKKGPDPRLLDAMRHAFKRLGEHEQALRWLGEVYRKAPDTAGILARYHHAFADLEGAATRRDGPYDRYMKVRRDLLARAKSPKDATARYVAAMLALTDGRYEEVIDTMRDLRKLAPRDARPHAIEAMIAVWRKDLSRATELANAAEKANPHDNVVPYARSLIARSRGNLPEAIKQLQHYLQMRRNRHTTRFRRKRKQLLSQLHMMRQGKMPPQLDRPDHPSQRYHLYSLYEPFELPSPPVLLGALAALLLSFAGGFWWSRGR